MSEYNFKEIEKKWKEKWIAEKIYKTSTDKDKKKMYVLDMFPFPSGDGLHVGHPKGYIATDVYSRMKKMQGYNVLHPMGWDTFGLPTEEFAIKNKIHPRVASNNNIKRFKEQLALIGFNYDWEREINTADPEFYKWTQWTIKQMFKKGLMYESNEPINWCPSCKTGLANEDLEDGKCERCGSIVEKKPIRQWVIKITDYAERLVKDLDQLNWPESIKESQRNWIGISTGSEIDFVIKNFSDEYKFTVFTTRTDTIFGCTYCVLAPEHKLVEKLLQKNVIKNREEVEKYIKQTEQKTDIERGGIGREKTGVRLNWVNAINPANGEEVPVYIADYVLPNYGTGAIMAVPAHDDRDFEFANKFNIPIKEVVRPYVIDHVNVPRDDKPTKTRRNVHAIVYDPKNKKYLILRNSIHHWDTVVIGGVEEGEDLIEAAKRELKEETGYVDIKFKRILGNPVQAGYFAPHKDENRLAIASAVYFELVSDKREDIAIDGENEGNEILWIDESDFVPGKMINSELSFWLTRLKNENDNTHKDDGILVNSGEYNGLSSLDARIKITEKIGGKIVKKTKLRDWVFARQRYWGEPFPIVFDENHKPFIVADSELPVLLPDVENYVPTGTGESPLANIKDWVDIYGYINKDNEFISCGKNEKGARLFKRETNTMPNWAGSSWYYLRYIDPHNDKVLIDKDKEKKWSPVDFYVGGAEHATRHLIYARFWHKFLFDIGLVNYEEPFMRLQNVGLIQAEDGRKMSKRWGNVVNPDDVVNEYGADALRLYEMFMGSFDQSAAWNTKNIAGVYRFLERVNKLLDKVYGEKTKLLLKSIDQKKSTNNKTVKNKEDEYLQEEISLIVNKINFITRVSDSIQKEVSSIVSKLNFFSKQKKQEEKNEFESDVDEVLLNQTIKKVSEDIENFKFNTAISQMMILLNNFEEVNNISKKDFEKFILILAPFAPFITEELWSNLGNKESIHLNNWPVFNENKLIKNTVILAVQINGKLRGTIEINIDSTQDEVLEKIKKEEFYIRNVDSKETKKVIFVKNKLVNVLI